MLIGDSQQLRRHAGDSAVNVLQATDKVLQAAVAGQAVIEGLQGPDTLQSAELVVDPCQRTHAGTGGGHGESVTIAGDRLFPPRPGLCYQFPQASAFIETDLLQAVLHQCDLGFAVACQRLGREGEVPLQLLLVIHRAAQGGGSADAADGRGLTVLNGEVVLAAEADLGQDPRVQWQQANCGSIQCRQRADQLLVHQAIGALAVGGQGQAILLLLAVFEFRQTGGHIGQGNLGQDTHVPGLLLALLQFLRQLDHTLLVGFAHARLEGRQPFRFRRQPPRREPGVRCHDQGDTVRIVEQQAPGQFLDVLRVAYVLLQRRQHRVQVQYRDRVRIVGGGAQGLQDNLQTVGKAVAADFPLVQFQLVQHSLQLRRRHTLPGHGFDDPEYQCFQGIGGVCLATFNATAEDHLALGVLESAEGGGGLAEGGGFQCMHQR